MGYIYKITNIINGKVYIGKTAKTVEQRFEVHIANTRKNLKRVSMLYNAMKKYGVENFIVETLEECDESIIDEREKYFIKTHESTNPEIGYNMTVGGTGGITYKQYKGMPPHRAKHSEETKKLMSSQRLGHIVSNETRKKISKANTGKKRTEEQNILNRLRNQNKVWIKKDDIETTISKDVVDEYINNGWSRGRITKIQPWNKGLTAETDERVAEYTRKRKETQKNKKIN